MIKLSTRQSCGNDKIDLKFESVDNLVHVVRNVIGKAILHKGNGNCVAIDSIVLVKKISEISLVARFGPFDEILKKKVSPAENGEYWLCYLGIVYIWM